MHMPQKTGLVKLRRVLRAIRKHFPQPPEDVLAGNAIDKFLDDPDLCEDKLSKEAGSDGYLETIMKIIFPDMESLSQCKTQSIGRYGCFFFSFLIGINLYKVNLFFFFFFALWLKS
jgi:hypothetical protein